MTSARSILPDDTADEVRPVRTDFLAFAPPALGEEEIAEVADTLRSDWITTGPKTSRFEREFAARLGAPGALALNSCTAGLHTALVTGGIGRGDEVITSTLTFAASANVAEHVGARPVLVDVEPDTLQMDPERVRAAVTPKTRAIVVVHYAGHPADLDAIGAIAAEHRLLMVEDAAHALPARYRGRMIGSGTNPTAFSFYATKNMTTGEGGMLTGDPAFLRRARTVSLHGMSRDGWNRYAEGGHWFYEIEMPGFKYNMTDIQASLGLCQLRKLEGFQRRRREVVAAYHEAFAGEDALELPVERNDVEHAWHLYVLRLRPGVLAIDRGRFIEEMTRRRIGTSVHFIPLHLHPYYRDTYGYGPGQFPVAQSNYERMLSLPLHPGLSDGDVADVITAVRDIVRRYRR
ncbi:MAG TPA: DegT/DnrJ/EryC1/StrS aminotransferase family protein [Gemmatimonadales bacterium]|jgi:dTDP-4-amino-4,6-dideoxygalactose transaminase|nr:DegT/DnrJ/EryC1/StrS aminotransferase family protein [Gemmatimonadales bacterium]